MVVQVDTLHLLAQPKEGSQQFKNKKQPELTENQTAWKSDNRGNKEETFIQAGRRGGDGQQGGKDSQQNSGWITWVGKAAAGRQGGGLQTEGSHIFVQIN